MAEKGDEPKSVGPPPYVQNFLGLKGSIFFFFFFLGGGGA